MEPLTTGEPQGDAAPTLESIAGLFEAELAAEGTPQEKDKEPTAEVDQPETDVEASETGADTDETDSAVEADAATETDPESEPEEAPATQIVEAPSGMSEADRAVFAKLSPEMQSWVSKRMADQQADYTRKSQDVAEKRKAFEGASQQVMARLQQLDQYLSQFTDPQLVPPDPRLSHADPDEYQRQLAEYVHRKDLQDKASVERARAAKEYEQHQKAHLQQFYAEQAEELQRLAPELAAQTPKAAEMRKAVHRYGTEQGYTQDQLKLASARDIVTLWKASQFDAVQKAKANVKVVPKPAPKVVAPGPAKGGRPSNFAKAVQDLAQNPTVDALEAAFLAELQSEKR